jgi:hypothetical protein
MRVSYMRHRFCAVMKSKDGVAAGQGVKVSP